MNERERRERFGLQTCFAVYAFGLILWLIGDGPPSPTAVKVALALHAALAFSLLALWWARTRRPR